MEEIVASEVEIQRNLTFHFGMRWVCFNVPVTCWTCTDHICSVYAVKSGSSAWAARSKFITGESADCELWGSPVWCDTRFGETETRLPDGTLVQIGGEHEVHFHM